MQLSLWTIASRDREFAPVLHTLTWIELVAYTQSCESGSSSVVECFLAKEDVAGSTPVSRSKQFPSAVHFPCMHVGLQDSSGL
jgi:hypothetical protein